MLRLLGISVLVMTTALTSAMAQDGPNGTLNQDYFNPRTDRQWWEYKTSIDNAHARPGLIAFAEGNMKETQVQLEYALARTINHPQMLSLATLFSERTNNPLWAMPYFKHALGLYPQYAVTHAQFGKYLTDIGMVDDGLVELKKAAEMDPKLLGAQVWLAAAYAKAGNADLAHQSAEKAKALGYKGDLTAYGIR